MRDSSQNATASAVRLTLNVSLSLSRARPFECGRYRLVFLDPLTGCAARCGPDGHGYKLELPKKWLLENRKIISTGLKMVKICAAAGRLTGLPLPSAAGLPTQAVSKAHVPDLMALGRHRFVLSRVT